MARNKIGFSDKDFKLSIDMLDELDLDRKDVNRAASKALIPAAKEVKAGIASFKGEEGDISIALLLARMVRRRMSRAGYRAGARIVIDGPDIPMGDRDWNAMGVAKLFQKDDTGERSTRSGGASRGKFEGRSVGGGDNYIARFAKKLESTTNSRFKAAALNLMQRAIKKAIK